MLNEAMEDVRQSKKARVVFKVDFAKAYDSVDWAYLLEMMQGMNFPTKWICWMSGCVSSATAN